MSNNEIPEGFNMTELGSLPDEWGVMRLGDVAETRKETVDPRTGKYRYVGLEHIDPGAPQLKRFGHSDEVRSAKSKFYSGDILYGKLRPYLDKCVLIDFEGICSTDIIVIKTNNDVSNTFLSYFLHANEFRDYAAKTMTGVNHPRTSWRALSHFSIPTPPLPEQHRIASVLSAVQDAKEKTGAVIAAAKSLKKSLMRHLFTYGPVPAGAAEGAVLAETEIGLVPEGWEVVRLGEVAKTYSGGTPKRDKPEYWGGDIHWIKSGELNDKKVFTSVENITEEGLNNSSAKFVEENTLLIAMYGATAGKVGLAKSRFTINQAICAIVPNKNFDSEFYFYYLMNIRDKILAERFGGAQPNLNQQLVKNIEVPLPLPLIQQKIASTLSTVDKKIEAEENKKIALDELFKSLLHNLMTGKVRVNHLEMPQ